MFQVIINSLLPIFLVLGLGALLKSLGFLPPEFFPKLNRLVFYVGLPALLFSRIATSPIEGGPALRIFWVMLAACGLMIVISLGIGKLMKLGGPGQGAFMQAALRGNLAYIGLPVVLYTMAGTELQGSEVETTAMLVLAPTIPLYNIISVIVLISCNQQSQNRPSIFELSKKILTNPLLIACLLGLLVAWGEWHLPIFVLRSLAPLSEMALPLALLSIGASLSCGGINRKVLSPAIIASLMKVGLTPLLGFFLAQLMGLTPAETRMTLLFLACPTAVTGFIMAEQLGADEKLAGNAVVLSTLLSFFSLATVLLLTQ